ncbi:MAG: hypothetical protein LIR50_13630 [Bacillota bacterium]|nr:hypothetical protein [Bacillota bacterium]
MESIMDRIGYNNLLSLAIGAAAIICCSLIFYNFQKHLFKKYKGIKTKQ